MIAQVKGKNPTHRTIEYLLRNRFSRWLIFAITNVIAVFVFLFGLIAFWAAWSTAQELLEQGYLDLSVYSKSKVRWPIHNLPAQDGGPAIGFHVPSNHANGALNERIRAKQAWPLFVGTGLLVGFMFSGAAIFLTCFARRRKATILGLSVFVVSGWLAVAVLLIIGQACASGKEFLVTLLATFVLLLATRSLMRFAKD